MDLITCIEVFLNPGKGQPITLSLAEGVAILISDDIKDRKKIKDRIEYLYDIRSKLTHGVIESVEDCDINSLIRLTGSLIILLLERKDEFKNKAVLIRWLEYKRLGGEIENWPNYNEFLNSYKKPKLK